MSGVYINPRFNISSASSDGTNLTYICNNNFLAGQRVVVSGSSNPNFDTEDSALISATSTEFVIEDKSVSASATSTGGTAYDITGEWKNTGTVYAKISGTWRIVGETFAKIDGVWRRTTLGAPPDAPIMEYVSTGVFEISNYDPELTYEAIFKTGSGGTAILNTSNGIYTLSGPNSGFDVVSRYASGTPGSSPGYMERKAYRYSCRDVPYTCCDTCCSTVGSCSCSPPDPATGGCPPGTSPNGQCGCGGDTPCMAGTVPTVQCVSCNCRTCTRQVCDVLINEPGYTNSGSEWYKVS